MEAALDEGEAHPLIFVVLPQKSWEKDGLGCKILLHGDKPARSTPGEASQMLQLQKHSAVI